MFRYTVVGFQMNVTRVSTCRESCDSSPVLDRLCGAKLTRQLPEEGDGDGAEGECEVLCSVDISQCEALCEALTPSVPVVAFVKVSSWMEGRDCMRDVESWQHGTTACRTKEYIPLSCGSSLRTQRSLP